MATPKPSLQTQQEAMAIAKSTQKQGQTKEQTKLIAAGIQKGIEQYKKQQKAKARERDKATKQQKKVQQNKRIEEEKSEQNPTPIEPKMADSASKPNSRLPWILLAISWIGFIAFQFMNQ